MGGCYPKIMLCWVMTMAPCLFYPTISAQDQKLLENIIIDALEENRTKETGGEMRYRFTVTTKAFTPQILESTVRWNRDTAFWSYKLMSSIQKKMENKNPNSLEDLPVEYKLKLKDKLYTYNAKANQLHLNQLNYPDRLDSTYFMFDIFPESLGSRCCPPVHSNGKKWSDLVGSNYLRIVPMGNVTLERVSKDIIRQTRLDKTGGIGTIDFSLAHSGLPLRIEWRDRNDAESNSLFTYKWKKIANIYILEKCIILRGNHQKDGDNVRERIEFEAMSVNLSSGKTTMNFESLKELLPKNAIFLDHIRNRKIPLNANTNTSGLTDVQLQELSKEIMNKGFAKP